MRSSTLYNCDLIALPENALHGVNECSFPGLTLLPSLLLHIRQPLVLSSQECNLSQLATSRHNWLERDEEVADPSM